MTTRQIVEKLQVQHKDDLEKIGIDAKDYYFYDHVLRQLKNLEKQGELKSQLHRGGPYDVYLSWNFRGEQE